MDEFSFIKQYLAPLTFGKGEALALKDDAAIISPRPGFDLVVTKDALAEGTHFFKDDAPGDIARKLLRVNLSDLAAKSAVPYCCFLAVALPAGTTGAWLQSFVEGLKDDMRQFGCFLAGGDTVVHDGPLVLSMTAMGHAPEGRALLRSGAIQGDMIFVTGTIGDSYLGVHALRNKLPATTLTDYAIRRYHLPEPRISTGLAIQDIASACIDISDGLLADLEHICDCSQAGAEITLDQIPFSDAVLAQCDIDKDFALRAIAGGDDYELLFTAPAIKEEKIAAIARETGVSITRIGTITEGNGVRLLDKTGAGMTVAVRGYRHWMK